VNLVAALDDLRDQKRPLRLWIDAICIDQTNTQERNVQVGLMREIYSVAQRTIIYLGSGRKNLESFFSDLRVFRTVPSDKEPHNQTIADSL